MLSTILVRASLWTLFAIVVVVVGATLAVDLRVVDWLLGTDVYFYDQLQRALGILRDQYGVRRDRIDTALKVIGLAATITFGALGLLRAYLIGFSNLPGLLAQFADDIRALHILDRGVLLAPFASRNLRGDRAAPSARGIWARTLQFFRVDAHSRAIRRVSGTTERLDGDLCVLNAALRLRRTERITAHLVEGLEIAEEARRLPDNTTARQERNRAALAEFERALALDGTDLDALELAARQAWIVNSNSAEAWLTRLEASAQEQHRTGRRARALRLHAEYIAETDVRRAALRDVRTKLEAALAALADQQSATDRPVEPEALRESALANEELARLHMRRGTFTLVPPYLDEADELFERLPPPEGPDGRGRIETLRRELARARLGGDDPDDAPLIAAT